MLTLLTIGGSDSGGGAGIQADLKTFAALGAHGVSVITATTAQNTLGVRDVHIIPTEHVATQLETVFEDFEIKWAKTGMLPTEECIELVARYAKQVPLVVDPVVYAQSGARLIEEDALRALMALLTRCAVATPNIKEAEMLSGVRIKDEEDVLAAGNALLDMGVPRVVITGGHLSGSDYLFSPEGAHKIGGNLIDGGTHGSGCTYAAALVFYLASGLPIVDACERAKRFVVSAIRFSHPSLGEGTSPVNQMGELRRTAERYTVLSDVRRAVEILTSHEEFACLIPEVGTNIGMAIEFARGEEDVAAVCGRIVKARGVARACGDVEFGASGHVARMIVAAMNIYPELRAAMNIRCSKPILDACMDMGLTMGSFSRRDEPEGVSTMEWGITSVLSQMRADVVYDGGDVGKEPMVRLFGKSATEVANRALRIAHRVRR